MDRLLFWVFQFFFNTFFLFLSEQTQDWSRGNEINDGSNTKWYKNDLWSAKTAHEMAQNSPLSRDEQETQNGKQDDYN